MVGWGRLVVFFFFLNFFWVGQGRFLKKQANKSQLQLHKVELVWFILKQKTVWFFVDSTSSSFLVGVRFLLCLFGCGFHIQELCFQKVWGWWFQICRVVVLGTIKGAKPVRFLTKSVRRAYPPFNVVRGMQAWENWASWGNFGKSSGDAWQSFLFFKL